jgi:hypothetical protein
LPVNESETFLAALCERSFLKPWTHLNPQTASGKELADALIIFGSDMILLSVKERAVASTERGVAQERWQRRAIEKSIKQLSGAFRYLNRSMEMEDSRLGSTVTLPPVGQRKIHLICVALGGNEFGRVLGRSSGSAYVHIIDDLAVIPIFLELSTLPDFVAYLDARERFATLNQPLDINVGEEDLLAAYLQNGRSFDQLQSVPLPGQFERYFSRPANELRRRADELGYFWDDLILHLWSQLPRFTSYQAAVEEIEIPPPDVSTMEKILRTMALHVRYERRSLGWATLQFFGDKAAPVSRVLRVGKEPVYVLLNRPGGDRASIQGELIGRCSYVQEFLLPGFDVIGIASTSDLLKLSDEVEIYLCFLEGAVGTKEMRQLVEALAREAGWFQEIRGHSGSGPEFKTPPEPRD